MRGFRIELGEIEAALRAHPAVREARGRWCARTCRATSAWWPTSCPRRASAATRTQLRALPASSGCPSTWCPRPSCALEALPLTPNGKVDRKALPAPGRRRAPAPSELRRAAHADRGARWPASGPRCWAWSGSASTTTSSSWAATRCWPRRSSRACAQPFGVELPLRALFEAPTVAALAERVEAARRGGRRRRCRRCVPRAARRRPLPLSFAQQRLWFLDQLEPGSAAYNMPDGRAAARARSTSAALERALRARSCAATRSLRTTFRADGRRSRCRSSRRRGRLRLPVVDLSALPEAEREAEAAAAGRRGGRGARSTWRAGPLLRATLLRLGDAGARAAADDAPHRLRRLVAWACCCASWRRSTRPSAEGRPSPLPELPVQYADYAVWQREWLQGEVLERAARPTGSSSWPARRRCWSCRPTGRARRCRRYRGARRAGRAARGAAAERLQALSRQRGRHAVHDAAGRLPGAAVAATPGRTDIVVGTPDRRPQPRARLEGLIGFFVNTLVLRTDLSGDPTLPRAAGAGAGGGAGRLRAPGPAVRAAGRGAAAGARPEPHAAVPGDVRAAERAGRRRCELPGLQRRARVGVGAARRAKFDLHAVAVRATAQGCVGDLEYNTDLFERGDDRADAGAPASVLLEAGRRGPGRAAVASCRCSTEAERAPAAGGVERHATPTYPRDACVHELFEAQAARTPDAVARGVRGASS